MVLFRKVIARPGKYLAKRGTGKREFTNNTKERLAKFAETGNKMIADGHLIPAPFAHVDSEGIHPIPLFEVNGKRVDSKTQGKPRWDQSCNSGFWSKFEIGEDGEWIGYLEAEGSEDDPSTPAGQIKSSYRQTSPFFIEDWIDGLGRQYKDSPLHICVTNNAVEPGQKNFEKVASSEQELALAMSFSEEDFISSTVEMSDNPADKKEPEKNSTGDLAKDSDQTDVDSDNSLQEAENTSDKFALVKEALLRVKITLPDDTDQNNFMDRLYAILLNIPENQEDEGLERKEPKDSETQQLSPTIMATEHDQAKTTALIGMAIENKKAALKGRVNELVRSGRVGRKHADEKLIPAIDGIQMSLDDMGTDGALPLFPVEMSLDALEDNVSLVDPNQTTAMSLPEGSEEQEIGDFEDPNKKEVTQEEANAHIDRLLGRRTTFVPVKGQ